MTTTYDIEAAANLDATSTSRDWSDCLEQWINSDKSKWPTPDIGLLRKAWEWVELQATLPEETRQWNQQLWQAQSSTCGTTFCVAGYICEMTQPVVNPVWRIEAMYGSNTERAAGHFISADGLRTSYSRCAGDELGISELERGWLFTAENQVEHIRAIIDLIMQRAGDRL